MSTLQENILDAVKILADSSVRSSNATITIECQIVEAVDAAIGLYKVSYMANEFEAYGSTALRYKPGDIVFVLVPDGNLTKTKTIIGATAPKETMYITEEPSDSYVEVSDNLLGTVSDIELCTYHTETYNLDLDLTDFDIIFQDYLNSYRTFVFSAQVKTDIAIEQQVNGNYGVVLSIPVLEDAGDGSGTVETYKSVSIDVNTIQGNPYRLNEYSLQNIYFQLAEDAQYDASREPILSVFVQDFMQDESKAAADIWIKDINFKMVDLLTEEEKTGYSLTLVATQGNYFLNSKYADTKTLTPVLKINGKTKAVKGYDCYWFAEDASIGITSAGYSTYGGLGWKCLNAKSNVHYDEEGRQVFQYVTNSYSLEVVQTAVPASLKYKCVLVKNDVFVSGIITLKNLESDIQYQLVSATGSNSFVANTGNVTLIVRVTGMSKSDLISLAWQRFDKDGNYLDNDFFTYIRRNELVEITDATGTKRTWYESEISYPCSSLVESNTVNCTFYRDTIKDGLTVHSNLGTASIFLTASDDYTYKISIQNGDVLYKYDADGDSPLIADYDGPESSRVKEIRPLQFKVYKADGTELSETEYLYCRTTWRVPKNSMMKLRTAVSAEDSDYYYISGQGQVAVNYTLLDTYNVKKNDNTVQLTVVFNGNTLIEVADIKFLKDGESGTNGSKYAGIVTYNGYSYGAVDAANKVYKLQMVYIESLGWYRLVPETGELEIWTPQTLDVSVYCDGERLTSTADYTLSWSMFDYTVTNPIATVSSGTVSVATNAGKQIEWRGAATSTIVEVKITVGNTGVTGGQEIIYAYYPIEVTYLSNGNYTGRMIPRLDGGFDKVLYAADGTNPKYDSANPFSFEGNLELIDGSEYFTYTWAGSENLTLDANGGVCTARPITKFDNGKSQNYIRVRMAITSGTMSDLQNILANLNAAKTDYYNKVIFFSEVAQYALDFRQNFDYTYLKGLLNESKNLLNYRSKLLQYLDQLFNSINNIKEYCINKDIDHDIFNYDEVYNTLYSVFIYEQKTLWRFGYATDFDDLDDLSKYKLNYEKAEQYKAAYGIGSYEVFNSYLTSYNDLLNQYQGIYNLLTDKDGLIYVYQDEWTKFKKFENTMIGLPQQEKLAWLVEHSEDYSNVTTLDEYVNLQAQIEASAVQLYSAPIVYSYSAIVEDILDYTNNLTQQFTDDIYCGKFTRLEVQMQSLYDTTVTSIEDYEKITSEGIRGYIIHSKPIVMLYNRYELSNINGWDGNKLYIDSANNEYLLAPQVGAGLKKDGLFTGAVMGVKQFTSASTQHIGLFGYHKGIQSYFMNSEDGSVIMGKSGSGQIIADPSSSKALLYSSNFFKNFKTDGKPSGYSSANWAGAGMLIDLTTPEIRFGTGNFVVNSSGHITAKGGGSIAGWSISDNILTGGSTTLNSNGTITCVDLIANNSGSIGGWKIGSSGLFSSGNRLSLYSDGHIVGPTWEISTSGVAKFSNVIIAGNGASYLTSSGSSMNWGSNFSVDQYGNLKCNNAYVSGEIVTSVGRIGSWTINSSGIIYTNSSLSDGRYVQITPDQTIFLADKFVWGWKNSTGGYVGYTQQNIFDNIFGGISYWLGGYDRNYGGTRIKAIEGNITSLQNGKANHGSYGVSGSISAPKGGGSCSFSLSVSI